MELPADTNVVLRYLTHTDPRFPVVREAVRRLGEAGDSVCVTPQNCIELWNVLTRPTVRNGYGYSPADAAGLIQIVQSVFPLLPDTPDVYPEWLRLVTTYGVSGVQVHDARLAAVMRVHGVGRILTFNGGDFARYTSEGVAAVNPSTV